MLHEFLASLRSTRRANASNQGPNSPPHGPTPILAQHSLSGPSNQPIYSSEPCEFVTSHPESESSSLEVSRHSPSPLQLPFRRRGSIPLPRKSSSHPKNLMPNTPTTMKAQWILKVPRSSSTCRFTAQRDSPRNKSPPPKATKVATRMRLSLSSVTSGFCFAHSLCSLCTSVSRASNQDSRRRRTASTFSSRTSSSSVPASCSTRCGDSTRCIPVTGASPTSLRSDRRSQARPATTLIFPTAAPDSVKPDGPTLSFRPSLLQPRPPSFRAR